eukprot:6483938-Amphidinium_carterae.1
MISPHYLALGGHWHSLKGQLKRFWQVLWSSTDFCKTNIELKVQDVQICSSPWPIHNMMLELQTTCRVHMNMSDLLLCFAFGWHDTECSLCTAHDKWWTLYQCVVKAQMPPGKKADKTKKAAAPKLIADPGPKRKRAQ